jgi:hypothetical protein
MNNLELLLLQRNILFKNRQAVIQHKLEVCFGTAILVLACMPYGGTVDTQNYVSSPRSRCFLLGCKYGQIELIGFYLPGV